MVRTVGQRDVTFSTLHAASRICKTSKYQTTHITLPSTAPVRWSPGIRRALWRSTDVAVVDPRPCVALSSPWRRPCQRNCGHQGRGRMVYCMAGSPPLRTQRGMERCTISLESRLLLSQWDTSNIWCTETKSFCNPAPPPPPDICRVAVPTGYARACHREDSQPHTWPCSNQPYEGVNTITEGPLAAVAPPAAGQHNIDPQQSPSLHEISSNCPPLLC